MREYSTIEELLAEQAAGRATCCRQRVDEDPVIAAQDAMEMGSQDPEDWA